MEVRQRYCAKCKQPIPLERLEILPETRLCIACCQAMGGEFDLSMTQESLGKAGSLKKNYGGVTVTKRRKPIE